MIIINTFASLISPYLGCRGQHGKVHFSSYPCWIRWILCDERRLQLILKKFQPVPRPVHQRFCLKWSVSRLKCTMDAILFRWRFVMRWWAANSAKWLLARSPLHSVKLMPVKRWRNENCVCNKKEWSEYRNWIIIYGVYSLINGL